MRTQELFLPYSSVDMDPCSHCRWANAGEPLRKEDNLKLQRLGSPAFDSIRKKLAVKVAKHSVLSVLSGDIVRWRWRWCWRERERAIATALQDYRGTPRSTARSPQSLSPLGLGPNKLRH